MSPALLDRFLSTAPPRKPLNVKFNEQYKREHTDTYIATLKMWVVPGIQKMASSQGVANLKASENSVQVSHSVMSNSATPWTAAHQASLSITNSRSLLKLMSIELVMPSNQLILCCPLLFLPSIFPSIRVFSNKSALRIRWPKYWSFSFSISPSNEYSGLISFRTDKLDLFAVQRILKSLL